MNLIQTLDDELKQLHLNDFEKARYIYLRCCEIFSFDARWYFTDTLDDKKMYDKILNKKFNLEDIDTNLVICHSFVKHILKPLLDEFTNLDSKIVRGIAHSFITIKSNTHSCYGQEWKLDATLGDLARVKLDLPTKGFDCGISQYDVLIDEIDINLGFGNSTKEDYERRALGYTFTENIENVGSILKDSKARFHFSDATFLFDMLALAYSCDNSTFFDRNYNFHRLIEVCDEFNFFDLSKSGDEYKIKKIRYDDYSRLTRTLYHK